jgi:hypothetical protein
MRPAKTNISETPSIRYLYLRDKNRTPVACIAMVIPKSRMEVSYGVSTCNPADHCKCKVGRQLALGRAIENPNRVLMPWSKSTLHELLREVVDNVLNDKTIPNRARKAARAWMQFAAKKRAMEMDAIETIANLSSSSLL